MAYTAWGGQPASVCSVRRLTARYSQVAQASWVVDCTLRTVFAATASISMVTAEVGCALRTDKFIRK